MIIRGTIKLINPRWLLAAPGLLVAAVARVAAVPSVLRRVAPTVSLVGALLAPVRCVRRVVPTMALAGAFAATSRRLRRLVAQATQGIGAINALPRRLCRMVPSAAQAQPAINVATGARAYGTFKFANGTRIKLNGVSAKLIR